jgi:hypothetical protein
MSTRSQAQLARAEAAVANTIAGQAQAEQIPTPVGTPSSQLGTSVTFQVKGTTLNAASVTVDTGNAPPFNHISLLEATYSAVDRANHLAHTGNGIGTLARFATPQTIPGQSFTDGNGDATLATAVPSFVVTVGGGVGVTFTPPAGYVGQIEWLMTLTITNN